jgi:hypothetical protein
MAARPEDLQRAISIRQPYVELILRGAKMAEYRSRLTRIRERVYLYAARSPGDVDDGVRQGIALEEQEDLPRGVIAGSVEIAGCTWSESMGCWAWRLAEPRRYRQLLYPRGQPQPGFWRPRWD